MENNLLRAIAFYLPQFHPIPENDQWWGKGFTEWTNVTKARSLFRGHYQPHLPADLGFYDLRLPEARQAQAELARAYGIHGFMYYHYWFDGKRLLERPFTEVLESGEPDFPFCLCWANETWTRTWDGGSKDILIDQRYSIEDDRRHGQWMTKAFADPRYIRVNGKPLFAVYRASLLPDPRRTTDIWREEAEKSGVGEIFLCRVESNFEKERTPPNEIGFDAAIEFQPDMQEISAGVTRQPRVKRLVKDRVRRLLANVGFSALQHLQYADLCETMITKKDVDYLRFPCVTPSWDNSSRRKYSPLIFRNASPELYESWLSHVVNKSCKGPSDERIVFINAWNEWAEGNHLEPCQKHKLSYLESTLKSLSGNTVYDELPSRKGS